jgi:crotonobetainyl-CoA:carnitine CoA-transferase CaiB-like acyl-CoA transferase
MAPPLDGLLVLDFGQIFQGSYASLLLAKAGADVIKIEPPNGEPLRRRTRPGKKTTLSFAMLNANKRAITLNLKTERGRELFLAMARRADIVLENFGPGTMNAMGVGYAELAAINPRLIYATGTGYGISGPDHGNLAMDLTVQAASGIMAVTGFPDGPPVRAGVTVADFMGGIHLYAGIMTALYDRQRTGQGRLVEVAMLEAVYYTLAGPLNVMHDLGQVPPRSGNQSGGAISPYGVYPVKDGFVAIHTGTEGHWHNILDAAGRPELKDDPRFRTMHDRSAIQAETDAIVTAWTSAHTKSEIAARAKRFRVPLAPVREVDEVMRDRHMHERGMLEWVDHPDLGRVVLPTTPLRLHGVATAPTKPSRLVGADNDGVYGELLGLSAADIGALRRDGVI